MKLKSDKLIQTSIHRINHLIGLDWDLKCVDTRYVMHASHPYLEKYIHPSNSSLSNIMSHKKMI
jgi:hypothetical protein